MGAKTRTLPIWAKMGFSMFVAPNLRGLNANDHEIWHVGLISANLKYGLIRILIFGLGGSGLPIWAKMGFSQ